MGGEDLHELHLSTTIICICVLLVSVCRVVGGAVRELEEALYTVLAEHEEWEEKVYPATTLICTCWSGERTRELEEAAYTVLAEHEGWEERVNPATTLICIC